MDAMIARSGTAARQRSEERPHPEKSAPITENPAV
jgi:hypothetical protein